MPTVRISAPTEGLEPLILRGLRVATDQSWSTTRDPGGALVGFWLSSALRLAELTGGTIQDGAEALTVAEGPGHASPGRQALAAAYRTGWESLRSCLVDSSSPDEVSISVTTTSERDTGWLAALGIVAGAAVAGWAIFRVSEVVESVLQRRADASQMAADMAKLDSLAWGHVAREKAAGRSLDLDPVTRAQTEIIAQRSRAILAKQAEQAKPSATWSELVPVAALVAVGVIAWRFLK
jgi:hypothetical protein